MYDQVIRYATLYGPVLIYTVWRVVLAVGIGWGANLLAQGVVNRTFRSVSGLERVEQRRGRLEVLRRLLSRAVSVAIFVVVGIMVLQAFGAEPTPLVAVTSVAGIAIGIAAQPLLRDTVSGFFIILEDQYAVGDYVTIASVTGIVEDVSLRRTRLRDLGGQLYTIPHSIIDKTTNISRAGEMGATVDVKVAYEDDIERVLSLLAEVCKTVTARRPDLLAGEAKVLGVAELGVDAVTVRMVAPAVLLKHWELERELRLEAKLAFERAGLRPPNVSRTEKR